MDPISMLFYAIVCGCLGWAGPKLGAPLVRLGIGAGVGVVAATVLPLVRDLMGAAY